MFCNYKIFYNESFVLITCDRTQINKNFSKVWDTEAQIEEFLNSPGFLFSGECNAKIAIYSNKPGEVMCSFLDHFDIVIAGGGIVHNENDEVLLIFRRGKWDLPKGKIELNEKIADGAVREVEEETGVKIASIEEKPCITYHAYKLKGKNCIKETNWFTMKAKPGQSKLKPQTEEDIEEARWVKKSDLKCYQDGSFPLVWDLLEKKVLNATLAPPGA